MTFASPPFCKLAIKFSSVEYFAVVFFGLTSVVALSPNAVIYSIISLLIGIFLSCIGMDQHFWTPRFTFGTSLLENRIEFIIVII